MQPGNGDAATRRLPGRAGDELMTHTGAATATDSSDSGSSSRQLRKPDPAEPDDMSVRPMSQPSSLMSKYSAFGVPSLRKTMTIHWSSQSPNIRISG